MAYKIKTALLVALLLVNVPLTAAAELFRYEDDIGRKVWGVAVPPHLISKGYSVHDTNGTLIRTIPRTITENEEEEKARELAVAAREAELRDRQRQIDNLLLRRYGSLHDFKDRRKLATSSLHERKSAIAERLDKASRDIEVINQSMLRAKRANQQPSAVLVSQLANMEVVRLRLMEEMAKAEAEIREYNQQADMDYQRLTELLAGKK